MSSLFVDRVNTVTAGLAVAFVYLVTPGAAKATTCEIMPKSFACMSGAANEAPKMSDDQDTAEKVKVAAVRPAAIVNDADDTVVTVIKSNKSKKHAAPKNKNVRSSRRPSAQQNKRSSHKRNRGNERSSSEVKVTQKGWRTRSSGFMTARSGVVTSCFPARLRGLLSQVSSHYGRPLVITSGYRSPSHNRRIGGAKESQHLHCNAADFYIPGVSPGQLASYLMKIQGNRGVGTYCGNRTVHLDTGTRREWHWGCRRSRYAGRHSAKRRYASARFRGSKS